MLSPNQLNLILQYLYKQAGSQCLFLIPKLAGIQSMTPQNGKDKGEIYIFFI